MAFAPFVESVVHVLHVREHRSLLTRNHLPKHASFQAPRRHTRELPPKPSTSSNRRTVSLTMTTSVREIEATTTTPLTTEPVQSITGRFASRTNETRPYPALSPAHGRHRPFPQNHLNLDASRRDHDALAAPGKRRVEGAG